MRNCMRIIGKIEDGVDVFRPGTAAPSMHWANMLVDSYVGVPGISIEWQPKPTVIINQEFWQHCDHGFIHIMAFVRLHRLEVVIDRLACAFCQGHEACIA